jgi:hypothetical protein
MIQEGHPLTAKAYIDTQWCGDTPEELDPEEAEVITLLTAYEKVPQT